MKPIERVLFAHLSKLNLLQWLTLFNIYLFIYFLAEEFKYHLLVCIMQFAVHYNEEKMTVLQSRIWDIRFSFDAMTLVYIFVTLRREDNLFWWYFRPTFRETFGKNIDIN